METCCSINCLFISFCKDYDNNLDRSDGCVTQRLILNQVEKYKLKRLNMKNCYNCSHFDKNDYVHGYGTCELQDIDYKIDHVCNIENERICYDFYHFGEIKGESITTNSTLRKWDTGTPLNYVIEEWTDTEFECPEPDCGGIMQRNNMKVLTSNPVQYEYRCKKCGSIHYRFE